MGQSLILLDTTDITATVLGSSGPKSFRLSYVNRYNPLLQQTQHQLQCKDTTSDETNTDPPVHGKPDQDRTTSDSDNTTHTESQPPSSTKTSQVSTQSSVYIPNTQETSTHTPISFVPPSLPTPSTVPFQIPLPATLPPLPINFNTAATAYHSQLHHIMTTTPSNII